ncbi:uncharacterized protein C8R40DRAFT_137110 [Lentinula edodes]|uniref:uncharacterized protein n=1 Tax=Lentinula edodes TaxID=5353 RepID=UPI001E8EE563|nr:uncharacterized protein C8R40DRAFT_137110 [Lentinula edodes]KAH7876448.1 hypothetical protein C8R40DRAFT_137110 [Lentinula edodes]
MRKSRRIQRVIIVSLGRHSRRGRTRRRSMMGMGLLNNSRPYVLKFCHRIVKHFTCMSHRRLYRKLTHHIITELLSFANSLRNIQKRMVCDTWTWRTYKAVLDTRTTYNDSCLPPFPLPIILYRGSRDRTRAFSQRSLWNLLIFPNVYVDSHISSNRELCIRDINSFRYIASHSHSSFELLGGQNVVLYHLGHILFTFSSRTAYQQHNSTAWAEYNVQIWASDLHFARRYQTITTRPWSSLFDSEKIINRTNREDYMSADMYMRMLLESEKILCGVWHRVVMLKRRI